MSEIYFEARCGLGKHVRITRERWQHILHKHPEMTGREDDVGKVLEDPDEIRRSKKDASVFLYRRQFGDHYIRDVIKHYNDEALLITTFLERKAGRGELIWQK